MDRRAHRHPRAHVGGTTSALAVEAGAAALAQAGLPAAELDMVVLATCTPDQAMPATSAPVAHLLGAGGGALDVNAACSGFVYGLATAAGLVATGLDRVLLIGSDTMSRITDWDDRGTAILFADGAGAVVLEAVDGPGDLLGYDLAADGSGRHLLYADIGGYIHMDGREVFRRAVRMVVDSTSRALAHAGVDADDIDLFVPHQANVRIMDAAADRLGIPRERIANVIDRTGNTASGPSRSRSPTRRRHDRLHAGDLVLLCGFGAGMTVASAVLRWDGGR